MSFEKPDLIEKFFLGYVPHHLIGGFYRRYISEIAFKPESIVLEFGSGAGGASRFLAEKLDKKGGKLICVDISRAWINYAKRKLKLFNNIEYLCGRIQSLPIEDNSIHSIFVHYALHDVPEYEQPQVLEKFNRILKKEGVIYLREPARPSHGIPADRLEEMLTKHGFVVRQISTGRWRMMGTFVSAVITKAA